MQILAGIDPAIYGIYATLSGVIFTQIALVLKGRRDAGAEENIGTAAAVATKAAAEASAGAAMADSAFRSMTTQIEAATRNWAGCEERCRTLADERDDLREQVISQGREIASLSKELGSVSNTLKAYIQRHGEL